MSWESEGYIGWLAGYGAWPGFSPFWCRGWICSLGVAGGWGRQKKINTKDLNCLSLLSAQSWSQVALDWGEASHVAMQDGTSLEVLDPLVVGSTRVHDVAMQPVTYSGEITSLWPWGSLGNPAAPAMFGVGTVVSPHQVHAMTLTGPVTQTIGVVNVELGHPAFLGPLPAGPQALGLPGTLTPQGTSDASLFWMVWASSCCSLTFTPDVESCTVLMECICLMKGWTYSFQS